MIELLIVMSIIAILSSISIFALQGARSSGRDAKRKADLEDVRSAMELFRADCGHYPSALTFSNSSSLNGDNSTTACPSSNVYLQEMPADPSGSPNYDYNRSSNTAYCMCATLENVPASPDSCASVAGNYCVRNP